MDELCPQSFCRLIYLLIHRGFQNTRQMDDDLKTCYFILLIHLNVRENQLFNAFNLLFESILSH